MKINIWTVGGQARLIGCDYFGAPTWQTLYTSLDTHAADENLLVASLAMLGRREAIFTA